MLLDLLQAQQLLQRVGSNTFFVLITIHRIGMVFKTDTVPILICNFPCIIHIGIFIDDHRCRFEHIDEKNAKKDVTELFNEWFINLAKVGFHLCT